MGGLDHKCWRTPQLMRDYEIFACLVEGGQRIIARWAMAGPVIRRAYFQALIFGASLLVFGACREREKEGVAPPAPPSRENQPCKAVGPAPLAGLPARAHGYCIDPSSDVRRFGPGTPAPLDNVCVELFNGECELYKNYGLEGVKTLRYIPENGAPLGVNVVVSSFRRSQGAFGFYTRRILSGDLPSRATVKPLAVVGRAVAGVGMTVVWRGKHVVELTYVSDLETPREVEENSPRILHPLSVKISETLVGPRQPERIVRFLETEHLDTLGISVAPDGLLGIKGSGPATSGYYSGAKMPHRVVLAERRDKRGTSDLLRLLRQSGTAKKLKARDIVRLRRTQEGRPPETWYFRRQRNLLLGVGPLGGPNTASRSTPQERKARAKKWESFAIRRLMHVSNRELKFESK